MTGNFRCHLACEDRWLKGMEVSGMSRLRLHAAAATAFTTSPAKPRSHLSSPLQQRSSASRSHSPHPPQALPSCCCCHHLCQGPPSGTEPSVFTSANLPKSRTHPPQALPSHCCSVAPFPGSHCVPAEPSASPPWQPHRRRRISVHIEELHQLEV